MTETRFGILIDTTRRGAEAIGAATRDYQRLTQEVARLRAQADGSAASNRALGQALLAQRAAQIQLREALSASSKASDSFRTSLDAALSTVSGVSPAVSSAAANVRGLALSMQGAGAAAAVMIPLAAVAAIGALAAGAVSASRAIGEYQEKMQLAAEQTGLTVREVGGLTVAAANVGRSVETILPALTIFSRKIGEAAQGDEAATKAFADVGLSVVDATGKILPFRVILDQVVEVLKNTGSEAERNRIMFDLFGRGGASMFAVLNQSMEENIALAEKWGITLSDAQQKVASEADVASDRFANAWKGLQNQIQVSLAPAGTAIVQWATTFVEQLGRVQKKIEELRKSGVDVSNPMVWAFAAGQAAYSPTETTRQNFAQQMDLIQQTTGGVQLGGLSTIYAHPGTRYGPFPDPEDMKKSAEAVKESQKSIEKSMKLVAEELDKLGAGITYGALRPLLPAQGPRGTTLPYGPKTEDTYGGLTLEQLKAFGISLLDIQRAAEKAGISMDEASKKLLKHAQYVAAWDQRMKETFDGTIRAGVQGFFDDVVSGTKSIGQAFGDMISAIIAQLVAAAGANIILGFLGLQGGGRLVGLQGGGRFSPAYSAAYAAAIPAQRGVLAGGSRGMDTTLVRIGRGEGVFSNVVMDKLDRFLDIASMRPAREPERDRPSVVNVSVPLTVYSHVTDRRSLRALVEEDLVPEILKSLQKRSYRSA